MEILNRTNAPFGAGVWSVIDSEMGEFLSKRLNLRSIVDFKSEYDFTTDAISTNKFTQVKNENGLTINSREPLKMIEVKKSFRLKKSVIEELKRGIEDYDDSAFTNAANEFASFENNLILGGLNECCIDGILPDNEVKKIEVNGAKDILAGVAKAMGVFNKEFVGGTYKLVVSSATLAKLYTEFFDGISVKTKLDDILGKNEIVVNEDIGDDKALVLSQRGGDFEFYSGLDISIGYESETDEDVELFLIETCAFRVIGPEAAIVLNIK